MSDCIRPPSLTSWIHSARKSSRTGNTSAKFSESVSVCSGRISWNQWGTAPRTRKSPSSPRSRIASWRALKMAAAISSSLALGEDILHASVFNLQCQTCQGKERFFHLLARFRARLEKTPTARGKLSELRFLNLPILELVQFINCHDKRQITYLRGGGGLNAEGNVEILLARSGHHQEVPCRVADVRQLDRQILLFPSHVPQHERKLLLTDLDDFLVNLDSDSGVVLLAAKIGGA